MQSDAEVQFLDVLYRGVTDDDASREALALAQAMFRCASAAFVSFDAHDPRTALILTTGTLAAHTAAYMRDFAALDPAPGLFARLKVGAATTTDRMMTTEEVARDTFHNEFFRPIGLHETLGGTLFSDQARFALIGLQRGADRGPFDETDIAALERLMPHMARMLQLRRQFRDLRDRGSALGAVLDRLKAGVVLFDRQGRATVVNAAMSAIAASGDGLALDRQGGLLPARDEARRRLRGLLADVGRGGAGGIVVVPRSGEKRPYPVLVAPQPGSLAGGRSEATFDGTIVLVHDPDAGDRNAADILESALGLTRGAARLLAVLAADGDLRSFAEAEGVTIHTARFHLRTALGRTGAGTQAELVRLAVRLLRDIAIGTPK